MLEGIKDFTRRVIGMFASGFLKSVADVAKNESVASNTMMNAIEEWLEMYAGNAPWLGEDRQSLGIPAIIASEVARSVTLEMEVNVSGSPMAEFIDAQFDDVRKNIRTNTEYACAGGGVVFKPYVDGDGITVEVVQANSFYPTAYNNAQRITAGFFVYRSWIGKKVYTRIEKHELTGANYKVTNQAYVSLFEEVLGEECSLEEVPEWAEIEPEVYFENLDSTLFAYFRIPLGNIIDLDSPLGASVYSRSVDLIREADKQFQRLLWEYHGGELAIDASSDAFIHVGGKPVLPKGKERLYRTNNLDAVTLKGSSGDGMFRAWAPTLRDGNYMSGLNRLLIQIEDSCSLSRGTLSDPSEIEKSATEIKIMKQRSYSLVKDIQKSLEMALNDLVYAMYALAVLYDLAPNGEYETTYSWDDSIIVDAETERIRDMQEVSQGLLMPYEYRMKWYGEDEATARLKASETKGMTDDEILFGDVEE